MRLGTTALALFLLSASALAAEGDVYVREIKPLLKERCYSCHASLKQQGKLRVDTVASLLRGGKHGPALVAGRPEESLLLERIADIEGPRRMPPEGKPLTPSQIALIRDWVTSGARGPADEKPEEDPRNHWAFRLPQRVLPPVSNDPDWNGNPVDRFVAQEHARLGLKPVEEADRETLLRRVSLDLIGLPPTPEERQVFLQDPSPDAYEKVVERLLASPRYGERWGRHWMDVWRYSDWYGRRAVPDVMNSYAQIWRWRDWIVRSLNEERGYDRMVIDMLAADEVAPLDDAHVVATGFLVRNWFKWNYNQWMRDNVEHTAKAFLGLTVNCAHCHDHKYDPVTQEEYFRFRAFFEPLELRHDRVPGEPDPGPFEKYIYGKAYGPMKSGLIRVFDEKPEAPTFFYTGGDERNRVAGRAPVSPGAPAALGGDRLRIEPLTLPTGAFFPGLKPFVLEEERERRQKALVMAHAELRRTPADALATIRLVAAEAELRSWEARLAADQARHGGGPGHPDVLARHASRAEREAAVTAAEVKASLASATAAGVKGDSKAEKAVKDALAVVDKARQALALDSTTYTSISPVYPRQSSGRRLALARWIASPENPLTARVAVNHLWGWHFGRPLVETTHNLGRNGRLPSHPALLDWLAVELTRNGWQMKPLHRLLVTSRVYRLSSRTDAESVSRTHDPDNIFLWHYPTTRVEAEVVRDSLLYVAGELDSVLGGPEIPHEEGLISRRRSLYFAHHGESKMQFLEIFDAANPCDAYRRTTSVLPQQALALSNSELALRLSRRLVGRLAVSEDTFVEEAFVSLLGRAPTAKEREASRGFLNRQRNLFLEHKAELGSGVDPSRRARENLVHALFNHGDFVTVR